MNILDKLAVSLLVCCGMLVGQIEAAMPGAFTKVAAPNREGAADFSQNISGVGPLITTIFDDKDFASHYP